MSEEEKQAIKKLKEKLHKAKTTLFYENVIIPQDTAEEILNLISKQQKETEMLKAITQNYNAIGGETFGDDRIIVCSMKYFNDGYFKRNYIFKDKIKEEIKRLEKYIEELHPASDCMLIEDYETYIRAYKELLEGE